MKRSIPTADELEALGITPKPFVKRDTKGQLSFPDYDRQQKLAMKDWHQEGCHELGPIGRALRDYYLATRREFPVKISPPHYASIEANVIYDPHYHELIAHVHTIRWYWYESLPAFVVDTHWSSPSLNYDVTKARVELQAALNVKPKKLTTVVFCDDLRES